MYQHLVRGLLRSWSERLVKLKLQSAVGLIYPLGQQILERLPTSLSRLNNMCVLRIRTDDILLQCYHRA